MISTIQAYSQQREIIVKINILEFNQVCFHDFIAFKIFYFDSHDKYPSIDLMWHIIIVQMHVD